MVAVPLLVSLALALAVCPPLLRTLRRRGWTRPNHRGLSVVHPAGVAIVAVAVAALLVLSLVDAVARVEVLRPEIVGAAVFVVGVALLGLVDDLLGDRAGRAPRGVRSHARALVRGRPSTGALKAVGTAALAMGVLATGVLAGRGLDPGELLLAAAVLTLAVHVFNLLDLRPGRSLKALVLLGAGLTAGTLALEPLGVLGVLLAPMVVLLPLDLRERAMLGDTGAGAVGAVAGLWIVLTLPAIGQALALAALAAVALYGELRSISSLVDRMPLLTRIDSLGRCG